MAWNNTGTAVLVKAATEATGISAEGYNVGMNMLGYIYIYSIMVMYQQQWMIVINKLYWI